MTSGRSGPIGRDTVARLVTEVVLDVLPALPEDQVMGSRHLRDLGADSVDRVEIIVGVLHRLGLKEPLSSFGDLPDLDAMIDLLHERSRR